jgi:hypothetical protein
MGSDGLGSKPIAFNSNDSNLLQKDREYTIFEALEAFDE